VRLQYSARLRKSQYLQSPLCNFNTAKPPRLEWSGPLLHLALCVGPLPGCVQFGHEREGLGRGRPAIPLAGQLVQRGEVRVLQRNVELVGRVPDGDRSGVWVLLPPHCCALVLFEAQGLQDAQVDSEGDMPAVRL